MGALARLGAGPESGRPALVASLAHPPGMAARAGRPARAVSAVRAAADSVHPSISDLRKAKLEQPAQIMSADGKLIGEFKRSNRQWVPLEQISPSVVKALVATEDHRFYQHHGMDFTRTMGSVLHTLQGNPQGGSTITQQLARNLYPTEIGRARNINRKLKEAITAFKIEALYTKDEILETYLNTVPFLYNAYGIEMAARTYFDKPAARLTVLESATLVGMLKGNAYYNPSSTPTARWPGATPC